MYVPTFFSVASQDLRLFSVDRTGKTDALLAERRNVLASRIFPEGDRVVVEVLTDDAVPQS